MNGTIDLISGRAAWLCSRRFVPALPLWSLAMFSVDVLIIYGLAAHAEHRLRA